MDCLSSCSSSEQTRRLRSQSALTFSVLQWNSLSPSSFPTFFHPLVGGSAVLGAGTCFIVLLLRLSIPSACFFLPPSNHPHHHDARPVIRTIDTYNTELPRARGALIDIDFALSAAASP